MTNNEIEQIREIVREELEPIKNTLEEIKTMFQNLKKVYDNGFEFEKNNLCLNNELKPIGDEDNIINNIKEIIKSELSQVSYDTWIADCEGAIEGNILRWYCPNTFTQDILDKRYAKLILNACKLLELNIKEIKILVDKLDERAI